MRPGRDRGPSGASRGGGARGAARRTGYTRGELAQLQEILYKTHYKTLVTTRRPKAPARRMRRPAAAHLRCATRSSGQLLASHQQTARINRFRSMCKARAREGRRKQDQQLTAVHPPHSSDDQAATSVNARSSSLTVPPRNSFTCCIGSRNTLCAHLAWGAARAPSRTLSTAPTTTLQLNCQAQ